MHDVAVIGAGPYGLSLAAHLAASGVDFRIFGHPMQTWQQKMPRGMRLKSEGFASTLYDPGRIFPLSRYCSDLSVDYADVGIPVHIKTFIDYGLAFQQRFVPGLERQEVVSVSKRSPGFVVALENGTTAIFRSVVMAVGISHFDHVVPRLAALSKEHVSHSSARSDYANFNGRKVVVVGGGSSATDCAAALVGAGASVELLTRRTTLKFHNPPRSATLRSKVTQPTASIGRGWKSLLLAHGPMVFHGMPEQFRHEVTRRHLGPSSCWFTRPIIEANVKVRTGVTVMDAAVRHGRVALSVNGQDGDAMVEADHVIAATGYRVDIGRLTFLDPRLLAEVRTAADTPVLSRWFESSVPGLYFVGTASANAFGPLVRFACGAEFTAGRLARRLSHTRQSAVGSPQAARRSRASAYDHS